MEKEKIIIYGYIKFKGEYINGKRLNEKDIILMEIQNMK